MTERASILTIYTAPDCFYSALLKDDLRRAGKPYREIDVTLDPGAGEELVRLAGELVTPVVVEGGLVTIGYSGGC